MSESEITPNNIFVIIDPTSEKQFALTRAANIAKTYGAKIHAYIGIYSRLETGDTEMLKRVETARYKLWLDTFIEPIRSDGLEIDEYIDWTPDWRESMGDAANRVNSNLIVKPSSRRKTKSRIMITSSDITLLESARCPVLLTAHAEKKPSYKVLVAVDPKRENEKYRKLFSSILEMGKIIELTHADEGGELHVVYSYSHSDDYMHVTDVARATDVDPKRVHVISGRPEEAVKKVADELDAYLVIIGLSTGKVVANRIFGATSDWILNNLDHDILVMQ
ncbi:MAG: universal stress protein [Gammaproteobacteria bacterium]